MSSVFYWTGLLVWALGGGFIISRVSLMVVAKTLENFRWTKDFIKWRYRDRYAPSEEIK